VMTPTYYADFQLKLSMVTGSVCFVDTSTFQRT